MPTERMTKGNRGESLVAKLLRSMGYSIWRSHRSLGVFDIVATRGEEVVGVQVKLHATLSKAKSKPYGQYNKLMGAELPAGARRVWWAYCENLGTHHLFEFTPDGAKINCIQPSDLA
jgi:hypothetical protein